jgi:Uma2 family endonuclease
MATATLESPVKMLAEVLHELGDISPDRIAMPVGTATEQDVIDAMEAADKRLYELVDGVLVGKITGFFESVIASKCGSFLLNYLDENDRGIVFGTDAPFRIKSGRIRMPDAGFTSWDRFLGQDIPEDPIVDVIPNLAIEVISKGNTPKEMDLKLEDYFNSGVQLVWFIYPKTKTAMVYTSPTSKKELTKDQTLDGGKVLPGFTLPLKRLFAKTRRRAHGKKS